jgi:hypothetical protein
VVQRRRKRGKQESRSFLKKRTKKLFPFACAAGEVRNQSPNVFCFFFSKKKAFLQPPLSARPIIRRIRCASMAWS